MLRVSHLQLLHIAIDERSRLVHMTAAADEVHQGVGVILFLAEGLPRCTEGFFVKVSRER